MKEERGEKEEKWRQGAWWRHQERLPGGGGPYSQNGWDSGKDAGEIGKGRRSRTWRKIIGRENGGASMVLPPLTLQASAP